MSRIRKLLTARARGVTFSAAAAVAFASVFVAVPAMADSPGASHSPEHVWVDPTVRNLDGNYEWSFAIHFPEISGPAVTSASAPEFTTGPVHCQAPEAIDGGVLSCEGQGNAIPGEYVVDVELMGLAGVLHTWEVPLTVCPLTGCADVFSLTISPSTLIVWANPNIYDQTFGTYVFNTDWNPVEVAIDDLVDANGSPPEGDAYPVTERPMNGSNFGYRGAFTSPGYYYSTVTMYDEFGNPHEADYTVRVCTVETCRDLLGLANTGVDSLSIGVAAAAAVGLSGIGFAIVATRKRVKRS